MLFASMNRKKCVGGHKFLVKPVSRSGENVFEQAQNRIIAVDQGLYILCSVQNNVNLIFCNSFKFFFYFLYFFLNGKK